MAQVRGLGPRVGGRLSDASYRAFFLKVSIVRSMALYKYIIIYLFIYLFLFYYCYYYIRISLENNL